MVKNLPAMQGTQVQSLGQEDPLEREMAIHFSILTWRIPWTEKLNISLWETVIYISIFKDLRNSTIKRPVKSPYPNITCIFI